MSGSAVMRRLFVGGVVLGGVGLAFVAGRLTAPDADDGAQRDSAARDNAALRPVERPTNTTVGTDTPRRPRSGVERHDRTGDTQPGSDPHVDPHRDADGVAPPSAAELLQGLVSDAPPQRLVDAEQRAENIRAAAESSRRWAHRTAAQAVAAEIEEERAFLADEARGGTMNMLRALSSSGTHPFLLVEDATRFATHFARTETGPEVDGSGVGGGTPPAPGTVLRFPAGSHVLGVSQWGRGRAAFPADLVIQGAGRDLTTVRFNEFNADGEVRNLTFRDLTVDAGDDYLTDHRGQDPTTIRMERCRVIGFDMGAGGSVMLAANRAAFYASDTRFEAGYGRSPGSGNLFRVRSGLLARMERCVFVGPFRSVYDDGGSATYVFDSCRFENVKVPLERPPSGVRFVDCEVVVVDQTEIASARLEWQLASVAFDERGAVTIDGVAGTLPPDTAGPAAVVFPAGVHTLDVSRTLGTYRGPLIIRGQGRDSTLLRIGGLRSATRLLVRDATIDLARGNLMGNQLQLALLERVRLVRWDTGAGGSTAIDHRGGGVIALRDCEILDGFGRSPGRGRVLYLHDGTTVHFDRCRIELVGSAFSGTSGAVLLADSVLDGLPEKEAQDSRWSRTVTQLRSTVTHRPADAPLLKESRSLSELNSAWKDAD